MDHKVINQNICKINIGNPIISKDKNIIIKVLYDNEELSIKIPNSKRRYFDLKEHKDSFFNYIIYLNIVEDMEDFKEEYKYNPDIIDLQKLSYEFSVFINNLKEEIINCFFKSLEIDKNYLNIDFKELGLEDHEIERSLWNETIDYSFIPERKNVINPTYQYEDEDENTFEINIRSRFHVNNLTKTNDFNYILKCNIVFVNEKIEDKKHIYIDWYIV